MPRYTIKEANCLHGRCYSLNLIGKCGLTVKWHLCYACHVNRSAINNLQCSGRFAPGQDSPIECVPCLVAVAEELYAAICE